MGKPIWKLVKVQRCDIEPGDRKTWYCRIIRAGSQGLVWDVLCDGDIRNLAPLLDWLNSLTPRILNIMKNAEEEKRGQRKRVRKNT